MYYKLYKSNRFPRKQREKSDARHRWREHLSFLGWCSTMSHVKPKTQNRVQMRFIGRKGRKLPFIGYDVDRDWRHTRFIIEGGRRAKRGIRFLDRVGWRKEFYKDF